MSDIQLVPLTQIVFNRFQQSDAKNEAKILEIASSINQHRDNGTKGLLQVPTARLLEGGKYELAFGHHRFMAFQIADTWEVKLPKNFMTEAEAYQAELDSALKELEPQKAKK